MARRLFPCRLPIFLWMSVFLAANGGNGSGNGGTPPSTPRKRLLNFCLLLATSPRKDHSCPLITTSFECRKTRMTRT